MDLDWTLETGDQVTLVRVRLRNERATDRAVRVRNRLDGPVLPPRRNGTPEAGWDRDGATMVVPAGETVALGYACPAPEAEPPVDIGEVEPVEGSEKGESALDAAVRELGDHRPPRAVLGGTDAQSGGAAETATAETPEAGVEAHLDTEQAIDADDAPDSVVEPGDDSPPTDIREPLTRYRRRIETAEALGTVGIEEATTILATSGGLGGVEALAENLDADARELRALAATAATLAARAEAATPPIDALRRLS